MPNGIYWDGHFFIEPGIHLRILPSPRKQQHLLESNTLALIGDADSGEPYKIQKINDKNEALEYLQGGALYQAYLFAANPSEDIAAASNIVVMNVRKIKQAKNILPFTPEDAIQFVSKIWGKSGEDIQIIREGNHDKGHLLYIKGDEFFPDLDIKIFANRPIMLIQPTSGNFDYNVKIDGNGIYISNPYVFNDGSATLTELKKWFEETINAKISNANLVFNILNNEPLNESQYAQRVQEIIPQGGMAAINELILKASDNEANFISNNYIPTNNDGTSKNYLVSKWKTPLIEIISAPIMIITGGDDPVIKINTTRQTIVFDVDQTTTVEDFKIWLENLSGVGSVTLDSTVISNNTLISLNNDNKLQFQLSTGSFALRNNSNNNIINLKYKNIENAIIVNITVNSSLQEGQSVFVDNQYIGFDILGGDTGDTSEIDAAFSAEKDKDQNATNSIYYTTTNAIATKLKVEDIINWINGFEGICAYPHKDFSNATSTEVTSGDLVSIQDGSLLERQIITSSGNSNNLGVLGSKIIVVEEYATLKLEISNNNNDYTFTFSRAGMQHSFTIQSQSTYATLLKHLWRYAGLTVEITSAATTKRINDAGNYELPLGNEQTIYILSDSIYTKNSNTYNDCKPAFFTSFQFIPSLPANLTIDLTSLSLHHQVRIPYANKTLETICDLIHENRLGLYARPATIAGIDSSMNLKSLPLDLESKTIPKKTATVSTTTDNDFIQTRAFEIYYDNSDSDKDSDKDNAYNTDDPPKLEIRSEKVINSDGAVEYSNTFIYTPSDQTTDDKGDIEYEHKFLFAKYPKLKDLCNAMNVALSDYEAVIPEDVDENSLTRDLFDCYEKSFQDIDENRNFICTANLAYLVSYINSALPNILEAKRLIAGKDYDQENDQVYSKFTINKARGYIFSVNPIPTTTASSTNVADKWLLTINDTTDDLQTLTLTRTLQTPQNLNAITLKYSFIESDYPNLKSLCSKIEEDFRNSLTLTSYQYPYLDNTPTKGLFQRYSDGDTNSINLIGQEMGFKLKYNYTSSNYHDPAILLVKESSDTDWVEVAESNSKGCFWLKAREKQTQIFYHQQLLKELNVLKPVMNFPVKSAGYEIIDIYSNRIFEIAPTNNNNFYLNVSSTTISCRKIDDNTKGDLRISVDYLGKTLQEVLEEINAANTDSFSVNPTVYSNLTTTVDQIAIPGDDTDSTAILHISKTNSPYTIYNKSNDLGLFQIVVHDETIIRITGNNVPTTPESLSEKTIYFINKNIHQSDISIEINYDNLTRGELLSNLNEKIIENGYQITLLPNSYGGLIPQSRTNTSNLWKKSTTNSNEDNLEVLTDQATISSDEDYYFQPCLKLKRTDSNTAIQVEITTSQIIFYDTSNNQKRAINYYNQKIDDVVIEINRITDIINGITAEVQNVILGLQIDINNNDLKQLEPYQYHLWVVKPTAYDLVIKCLTQVDQSEISQTYTIPDAGNSLLTLGDLKNRLTKDFQAFIDEKFSFNFGESNGYDLDNEPINDETSLSQLFQPVDNIRIPTQYGLDSVIFSLKTRTQSWRVSECTADHMILYCDLSEQEEYIEFQDFLTVAELMEHIRSIKMKAINVVASNDFKSGGYLDEIPLDQFAPTQGKLYKIKQIQEDEILQALDRDSTLKEHSITTTSSLNLGVNDEQIATINTLVNFTSCKIALDQNFPTLKIIFDENVNTTDPIAHDFEKIPLPKESIKVTPSGDWEQATISLTKDNNEDITSTPYIVANIANIPLFELSINSDVINNSTSITIELSIDQTSFNFRKKLAGTQYYQYHRVQYVYQDENDNWVSKKISALKDEIEKIKFDNDNNLITFNSNLNNFTLPSESLKQNTTLKKISVTKNSSGNVTEKIGCTILSSNDVILFEINIDDNTIKIPEDATADTTVTFNVTINENNLTITDALSNETSIEYAAKTIGNIKNGIENITFNDITFTVTLRPLTINYLGKNLTNLKRVLEAKTSGALTLEANNAFVVYTKSGFPAFRIKAVQDDWNIKVTSTQILLTNNINNQDYPYDFINFTNCEILFYRLNQLKISEPDIEVTKGTYIDASLSPSTIFNENSRPINEYNVPREILPNEQEQTVFKIYATNHNHKKLGLQWLIKTDTNKLTLTLPLAPLGSKLITGKPIEIVRNFYFSEAKNSTIESLRKEIEALRLNCYVDYQGGYKITTDTLNQLQVHGIGTIYFDIFKSVGLATNYNPAQELSFQEVLQEELQNLTFGSEETFFDAIENSVLNQLQIINLFFTPNSNSNSYEYDISTSNNLTLTTKYALFKITRDDYRTVPEITVSLDNTNALKFTADSYTISSQINNSNKTLTELKNEIESNLKIYGIGVSIPSEVDGDSTSYSLNSTISKASLSSIPTEIVTNNNLFIYRASTYTAPTIQLTVDSNQLKFEFNSPSIPFYSEDNEADNTIQAFQERCTNNEDLHAYAINCVLLETDLTFEFSDTTTIAPFDVDGNPITSTNPLFVFEYNTSSNLRSYNFLTFSKTNDSNIQLTIETTSKTFTFKKDNSILAKILYDDVPLNIIKKNIAENEILQEERISLTFHDDFLSDLRRKYINRYRRLLLKYSEALPVNYNTRPFEDYPDILDENPQLVVEPYDADVYEDLKEKKTDSFFPNTPTAYVPNITVYNHTLTEGGLKIRPYLLNDQNTTAKTDDIYGEHLLSSSGMEIEFENEWGVLLFTLSLSSDTSATLDDVSDDNDDYYVELKSSENTINIYKGYGDANSAYDDYDDIVTINYVNNASWSATNNDIFPPETFNSSTTPTLTNFKIELENLLSKQGFNNIQINIVNTQLGYFDTLIVQAASRFWRIEGGLLKQILANQINANDYRETWEIENDQSSTNSTDWSINFLRSIQKITTTNAEDAVNNETIGIPYSGINYNDLNKKIPTYINLEINKDYVTNSGTDLVPSLNQTTEPIYFSKTMIKSNSYQANPENGVKVYNLAYQHLFTLTINENNTNFLNSGDGLEVELQINHEKIYLRKTIYKAISYTSTTGINAIAPGNTITINTIPITLTLADGIDSNSQISFLQETTEPFRLYSFKGFDGKITSTCWVKDRSGKKLFQLSIAETTQEVELELTISDNLLKFREIKYETIDIYEKKFNYYGKNLTTLRHEINQFRFAWPTTFNEKSVTDQFQHIFVREYQPELEEIDNIFGANFGEPLRTISPDKKEGVNVKAREGTADLMNLVANSPWQNANESWQLYIAPDKFLLNEDALISLMEAKNPDYLYFNEDTATPEEIKWHKIIATLDPMQAIIDAPLENTSFRMLLKTYYNFYGQLTDHIPSEIDKDDYDHYYKQLFSLKMIESTADQIAYPAEITKITTNALYYGELNLTSGLNDENNCFQKDTLAYITSADDQNLSYFTLTGATDTQLIVDNAFLIFNNSGNQYKIPYASYRPEDVINSIRQLPTIFNVTADWIFKELYNTPPNDIICLETVIECNDIITVKNLSGIVYFFIVRKEVDNNNNNNTSIILTSNNNTLTFKDNIIWEETIDIKDSDFDFNQLQLTNNFSAYGISFKRLLLPGYHLASTYDSKIIFCFKRALANEEDENSTKTIVVSYNETDIKLQFTIESINDPIEINCKDQTIMKIKYDVDKELYNYGITLEYPIQPKSRISFERIIKTNDLEPDTETFSKDNIGTIPLKIGQKTLATINPSINITSNEKIKISIGKSSISFEQFLNEKMLRINGVGFDEETGISSFKQINDKHRWIRLLATDSTLLGRYEINAEVITFLKSALSSSSNLVNAIDPLVADLGDLAVVTKNVGNIPIFFEREDINNFSIRDVTYNTKEIFSLTSDKPSWPVDQEFQENELTGAKKLGGSAPWVWKILDQNSNTAFEIIEITNEELNVVIDDSSIWLKGKDTTPTSSQSSNSVTYKGKNPAHLKNEIEIKINGLESSTSYDQKIYVFTSAYAYPTKVSVSSLPNLTNNQVINQLLLQWNPGFDVKINNDFFKISNQNNLLTIRTNAYISDDFFDKVTWGVEKTDRTIYSTFYYDSQKKINLFTIDSLNYKINPDDKEFYLIDSSGEKSVKLTTLKNKLKKIPVSLWSDFLSNQISVTHNLNKCLDSLYVTNFKIKYSSSENTYTITGSYKDDNETKLLTIKLSIIQDWSIIDQIEAISEITTTTTTTTITVATKTEKDTIPDTTSETYKNNLHYENAIKYKITKTPIESKVTTTITVAGTTSSDPQETTLEEIKEIKSSLEFPDLIYTNLPAPTVTTKKIKTFHLKIKFKHDFPTIEIPTHNQFSEIAWENIINNYLAWNKPNETEINKSEIWEKNLPNNLEHTLRTLYFKYDNIIILTIKISNKFYTASRTLLKFDSVIGLKFTYLYRMTTNADFQKRTIDCTNINIYNLRSYILSFDEIKYNATVEYADDFTDDPYKKSFKEFYYRQEINCNLNVLNINQNSFPDHLNLKLLAFDHQLDQPINTYIDSTWEKEKTITDAIQKDTTLYLKLHTLTDTIDIYSNNPSGLQIKTVGTTLKLTNNQNNKNYTVELVNKSQSSIQLAIDKILPNFNIIYNETLQRYLTLNETIDPYKLTFLNSDKSSVIKTQILDNKTTTLNLQINQNKKADLKINLENSQLTHKNFYPQLEIKQNTKNRINFHRSIQAEEIYFGRTFKSPSYSENNMKMIELTMKLNNIYQLISGNNNQPINSTSASQIYNLLNKIKDDFTTKKTTTLTEDIINKIDALINLIKNTKLSIKDDDGNVSISSKVITEEDDFSSEIFR